MDGPDEAPNGRLLRAVRDVQRHRGDQLRPRRGASEPPEHDPSKRKNKDTLDLQTSH